MGAAEAANDGVGFAVRDDTGDDDVVSEDVSHPSGPK